MAATTSAPDPFSASSFSQHNFIYDVFLSFRGDDTRNIFTDCLYYFLNQHGIVTFRDDDELPRGQDISSKLLQAIERSRISVIVFSINYASSRWCLEELVKIMECRRTLKQVVFPIFYYVDPSDVRHQTGSFAEAFVKHEERYLLDIDKVLRWRRALAEAANLSGFHLRRDEPLSQFIQKITREIMKVRSHGYLFTALYPVGIDACVHDMNSLLCVGADDVRMVGIWGMGGIGKTSIAKAVYNKFCDDFEGTCFLANVRETSKQHNGLVLLQNQFLSETLKTSKIEVGSVGRGSFMIQERLCCKKVLVIVDDVDHLDQLYAIAGSRSWFGSGSIIIITTRDVHLLNNLQVDEIYTAKTMDYSESLELFSWHAFRNSYPNEDYIDISKSVLNYCGGLPLALEVLGCYFFGMGMPEWKSALEKLKSIPHDDIQKKLRISFDGLSDNTVKDIFLDISCFFIGMDLNYVVPILDGCDLFATIGISVLIQRSLLTVGERNKLMMHDLLREMGRNIVSENYPKQPGKRSRLWLQKDVDDILTSHEGMEEVEGISLKLQRSSKVNFSTEAFIKMQRLRLLQLDHVQLTGDYEYLSKELRWLCWHGFPLTYMPNNFYSRKLVAVDLRYSNLREVWKDPKPLLDKLESLNLSHSHYLTRTPDFSRLPNLETLILKDCTRLFEVHQSIEDLHNLVLVNLKGCKSLKSLPRSLYKLKSLKTLILSGCSKIDNLADDLGEMECLTTLLADNTAIRQAPLQQPKNLECLSLRGCKGSSPKSLFSYIWSWISPSKIPKSVNLLPDSLQGWSSLKQLCLSDCDLSDDTVPKDLGNLCSLQYLDLQSNKFHVLPSSLGGLLKLHRLTLDNCPELQSIPDLPTSLNSLHATNCTALERMPNVSKNSSMQTLLLTNCHKLVDFPGLDKVLKSFGILHMEGCNNITSTFKQSILQECIMNGIGNMFSIFLPCDDIPDWFSYKDEGPSVFFEVPHITDLNLEGFAVCIVYSPCAGNDNKVSQNLPSISVVNHTNNFFQTARLTVDAVVSHKDHLWLGNVPICKFNLEYGDEVKVIVHFGDGFIVKKIGISLLCSRVIDGKLIHYASASNKYAIVVSDNEDVEDQARPIKFRRRLTHDKEAGPSHCWLEDEPNHLR